MSGPSRKIIQIAATSGGENNETDMIYALCDDGTLWTRSTFGNFCWKRIEEVPQPDEES